MNSKSCFALVAAMLLASTALSSPGWADGGTGGDSGTNPMIGFAGGAGGTGTSGGAGANGDVGVFQNTGGGGGGGGAAGGGQGGAGGSTPQNPGGAGGSAGATGGDGENGWPNSVEGGGGGGGGGGGNHGFSGAALAGASSGGNGGNGGRGGEFSAGPGANAGGGGGGGGAGGYGAIVNSASVNSNALLIAGGNGGAGGAGGSGPGGNINTADGFQGNGGDGGVGVLFSAGGASLINSGSVTGGAGGAGRLNGAGGAGVVGAGLTIINTGTIAGGLGGDGVTRANAITFTGGVNIASYTGIYQGGISVTGGSFAPALSGSAIGTTLSTTGPITFAAGTTYNIRVSPAANDSITATGAATLTGATVNATYSAGAYVSKQYTILTASGFGGTTFASLTNSNQPANTTASLSYSATNVFLDLTLNFSTPNAGGLNSNQQNVAGALTNYFNTTGGVPSAFVSLNANGLSQVAGEPGGGVQQSALTGAGMFMGNVFDNAFGNTNTGGQGSALGYAPQRKISSAAQDAYAAVTPRDRQTSLTSSSFEQRWSMWAAGYGGSARVAGDSAMGSHDTTSRVYGMSAGATWRASANTQLGFALGGAGSSFGIAEGFGSGKADAFNAAIYARHAFGPAYVAAALGYSWQDASTDRTVSAGGATEVLHASFRPQALSTRLETGRRFVTTAFGVTPYAAVQTVTLAMPSYAETATSGTGVFALSYGSRRYTAARGELGARFDKAMMLGDKPLTLKAKAAWAHDWNNDSIATATFQQLPGATFTVNGATPAANSALLSFGADLALGGGWTLGAGFDGEFSRTTASYSGKGSLRYAW